jgi:small subunit ribosomal protein S6
LTQSWKPPIEAISQFITNGFEAARQGGAAAVSGPESIFSGQWSSLEPAAEGGAACGRHFLARPRSAGGPKARKENSMRKFETLLLLSPELSVEARTVVLDGLKAVIDREGGRMLTEDVWGMRDLAYPVQKQMRGFYVRLEYAAPGALVAELERNIRIADGIFKFVTVKLADSVEEVAA